MSLRPTPEAGPSPDDALSLTVHVDLVGGQLQLVGRLDRVTSYLFHDAISTLLIGDRDRWVLDVTQLSACDHMGVRAIAVAYRRALRNRRRMILIGAAPPLRQQLERVHLDHHVLDNGTTAIPNPVPA